MNDREKATDEELTLLERLKRTHPNRLEKLIGARQENGHVTLTFATRYANDEDVGVGYPMPKPVQEDSVQYDEFALQEILKLLRSRDIDFKRESATTYFDGSDEPIVDAAKAVSMRIAHTVTFPEDKLEALLEKRRAALLQ